MEGMSIVAPAAGIGRGEYYVLLRDRCCVLS